MRTTFAYRSNPVKPLTQSCFGLRYNHVVVCWKHGQTAVVTTNACASTCAFVLSCPDLLSTCSTYCAALGKTCTGAWSNTAGMPAALCPRSCPLPFCPRSCPLPSAQCPLPTHNTSTRVWPDTEKRRASKLMGHRFSGTMSAPIMPKIVPNFFRTIMARTVNRHVRGQARRRLRDQPGGHCGRNLRLRARPLRHPSVRQELCVCVCSASVFFGDEEHRGSGGTRVEEEEDGFD